MSQVDGIGLDVPGPIPPFPPAQIRAARLACASACVPTVRQSVRPKASHAAAVTDLTELLDMLGLPRNRDLVPHAISRLGHAEVWNVVESGPGSDEPALVHQADTEDDAWKVKTRRAAGYRAEFGDQPRPDVAIVHVVATVIQAKTEADQ